MQMTKYFGSRIHQKLIYFVSKGEMFLSWEAKIMLVCYVNLALVCKSYICYSQVITQAVIEEIMVSADFSIKQKNIERRIVEYSDMQRE